MHTDSLDARAYSTAVAKRYRPRPLAPEAVRQLGVGMEVMSYAAFVYLSSSKVHHIAQELWVDNAGALRAVAIEANWTED